MFSYFDGGIKDTVSLKPLDFPSLIRIIKSNPNADKIEAIRNLRKKGDVSYKKLKKELPNITPNCMVKIRSLKAENFDQNFISSSQYVYFDFDVPNAEECFDIIICDYFI